MKRAFGMGFTLLMGVMIAGIAPAAAADLDLVQSLSKNLGITEKQASGGAGSIFNFAKEEMDVDDFTKLAQAVPGMDSMLAAAPKVEGAAGAPGGASEMPGGSTPSVSGVASLAGSFSQLGMKTELVNIFIPIILNYVLEKGGFPLMNALRSVLQ
jgi:hypothetical protein